MSNKVDRERLAKAIVSVVIKSRKHTKTALFSYFSAKLNESAYVRVARQVPDVALAYSKQKPRRKK